MESNYICNQRTSITIKS